MPIGLLDSACITSVIDCLHCQKIELASPWAYRSAIEATAELLVNPYFGLAPSIEGTRASSAEFGEIQKHLALRPSKPLFKEEDTKAAEKRTKRWFRRNNSKFRQSFIKQIASDDFKNWLNHEADFIWINHAKSQRGLFNNQLILELAILLKKDRTELKQLQQLSSDLNELQKLITTRRGEDFVLLRDAYTGAFFLRGIYHDYVAKLSGHSIMPHRLRRVPGFLPKRTGTSLHFEHSTITSLLADLILRCARRAKSTHRTTSYSEYVSNARLKMDSLDLSPKSRIEAEMDAAARAAKTIDLHSQKWWIYEALDAGIALLSGGITSFCLVPWYGFAAGLGMWLGSQGGNLGLRAGAKLFDTETRFKAMLEGPPGRLVGNWS